MKVERKSLGICIGASSIKVVEVSDASDGLRVGKAEVIRHECNTRESLLRTLKRYEPAGYDYVCVTGRKFKDLVNLPTITEPEAVERALRLVWKDYSTRFRALMSLGSESFILYQLNAEGAVVGVRAGNKCASGTGEFFLQQIRRMDIRLDEACGLSAGVEPYCVSGRCSVFCKSDCTHALNKGIPKQRVCAGLGNMIAEKALEILGCGPRKDVLIVGGVTNNAYVVRQLRGRIENLVIPPHAEVFEALGAAVYALEEHCTCAGPIALRPEGASFSVLPPLRDAAHLVTFQQLGYQQVRAGDETVLGLDVGSTTTKAVLMRTADSALLASIYLRTNGDPIKASRECYRQIAQRLQGVPVGIIALGVTGSGRYIAGLHAQTDGIINEIIAHATAAAFFDQQVDTILEIGGQDAKYTFLVNGVPCDYAMNEACSAGTGSFLEEAAKESLNIDVCDIQQIALGAEAPPNFNDQCAAFISSDIKNASHEISRDNIVAGLVYSICMNYNNRVKGSRKVGQKVFMQGGVCYNQAVPLAMAALLGKPVIVPPEPGLMGAFGVALEAQQRVEMGLLERAAFDLGELAGREVSYGQSFTCPGTRENCDRGCQINVIQLDGRKLPFGGVCNKYYNLTHHVDIDPRPYDFVARRQQALLAFVPPEHHVPAKTIGLTRSFLTNLLYPLYSRFFSEAGFRVVLPDAVDPEGIKRTCASFCFPAELGHGMLLSLARKNPDYIFLPQVSELFVEQTADRAPGHQSTCVIVHGEPFYLRSAFPELDGKILSPRLNWAQGWRSMRDVFVDLAEKLGCPKKRAAAAFEKAVEELEAFFARRRELGREVLKEIERDPRRVGIVLFGRPYNAFAAEANMGIPRKFASRGVYCLPFDCLPFHEEPSLESMMWAMGQDLVRAAHFVKKHPQLFGAFLTNFSCGPDSFVVGYFRDIMKTKPSLTLEIDNHTADAGVNTRVEAFLDIIERYRRLAVADPPEVPFRKAQLVLKNGKSHLIASDGSRHGLKDPRVKVLFPSMGRTVSELASATFRGLGIRSEAVPLPDFKTLMQGRANTSCKECLPLILMTGSMIDYVERHQQNNGDLLLYFMPTTNGNCRFGQYHVYLNRLIEKRRIEDMVTFTLSSENGYGGLGPGSMPMLIKGVILADVMDDIKNALYALATDRQQAAGVFDEQWRSIVKCFEDGCRDFYQVLRKAARRLASIPLRQPIATTKKVLLAGEIFVRKDEFSSQRVIEALARRQIVVQRAPMLEWIRYVDYWVRKIERRKLALGERIEMNLRMLTMGRIERKVKRILAASGLYQHELVDIAGVMNVGQHFVHQSFGGETILVVGRFFKDILKHFHGMISIGPFACLPTRIIEAILTPESRVQGNRRLEGLPDGERLKAVTSLPFLSIECDGNPFPQIIEAQIEAFCLQVERVYALTKATASAKRRPAVRPVRLLRR
jgi:predicted CoA-substrate-specific enzyme activase